MTARKTPQPRSIRVMFWTAVPGKCECWHTDAPPASSCRDDPMHLGTDRTHAVVEANLAANALLTCHATLPYGDHPDFGPAVCAGYRTRHRNDVTTGRLAQMGVGILPIDPPPLIT